MASREEQTGRVFERIRSAAPDSRAWEWLRTLEEDAYASAPGWIGQAKGFLRGLHAAGLIDEIRLKSIEDDLDGDADRLMLEMTVDQDAAASRGALLLAMAYGQFEEAHALLEDVATIVGKQGEPVAIRDLAAKLPALPASHAFGFLRGRLEALAAEIEQGHVSAELLERLDFARR